MNTQEQIKQNVVNHLTWDSRVDASDISVTVEDRTIRLGGTVPSYAVRKIAEKLATEISGVKAVHNSLNIKNVDITPIPTDQELRQTITRILEINSQLNEPGIDVQVEKGKVTLKGSVPSFWEKLLAEYDARSLLGVTEVVNTLTVVPTDKLSDEIISQRVLHRIQADTQASVEEMDIKVSNGAVELSGTVPSWHSRRDVYDAVKYIFGVTDVENNLEVAS